MKCIWNKTFISFSILLNISPESYLLTSIQRVKGITNGLRRYFAEVVTSKIILITPTLRATAWAAALVGCKSQQHAHHVQGIPTVACYPRQGPVCNLYREESLPVTTDLGTSVIFRSQSIQLPHGGHLSAFMLSHFSPTLCEPMDCSQAPLSMGFSRQEF